MDAELAATLRSRLDEVKALVAAPLFDDVDGDDAAAAAPPHCGGS